MKAAGALTLPALLVERARTDGDRTYVTDVFGRTLTYGETLELSLRWAAAWRGLGVERGDYVVTMRLNSIDGMLAWLGLAWLGAVEVPINTDYRGALLVHALNLTQAKVALVQTDYAPRFDEVAADLLHLEQVVTTDEDLLAGVAPDQRVTASPPAAWDLMGLLFTSGTTGPSKAVRIPWAQLHATATGFFPIDDFGPDDVIYNPGPSYHVGAKAFAFFAALCGGRHVVRPFLSFTELGADYLEHGVTTGFPVLPWLADPPRDDDATRPLRNLLVPQPIPGLDDFKRRFGCRSYGCFNMTEVSCPVVDPGWDAARFDENGRMSCGQARPGYDVRVVDEHDQPVPPGTVGELLVRSDAPWVLNDGYVNMPEATAAAWRNGWFHTGDAFVADADGYYYFIDRIKDCIRRHGENISSAEVETHVAAHAAVAEAAAVAVDVGGDEEVKVAVVLAPDAVLQPDELVQWLIPRMPRFMIPRFVEIVDALPRTPTMKVRKAELREHARNERTWDREAAGVELPRL